MALFCLFVLTACCTTIVSANYGTSTQSTLVCANGAKQTQDAEGDIEFPSASVNGTLGECQARIRYQLGDEIELTLFNVARGANVVCGANDYIEIFWTTETGKRVFKYCISTNDSDRTSPEAGHKKILKTNEVTVKRYNAPLNELVAVPGGDMVTVHYRKLTKPCRYDLIGQTGTLQSPSYPAFSSNVECEWSILNTVPGTTKQLTFKSVYLSTNCNTSYIEVYDEKNQSISKICGKHQNWNIQSKSSKLLVRMKSTTNLAVRFYATYKSEVGCLQSMSALNAQPLEFQAPINELCKKWALTAFKGQTGALSFSQINLPSTSDKSCSGNVVEVWDGDRTAVYCNSNLPPQIIKSSKGHTIWVTYRSVVAHGASNTFHASFTSVLPSKYKTNCFVHNMALYFKCRDQQDIPCDYYCDGATQCPDNSDEDSCYDTDAKWKKLEIFVIVMGSICASMIIFCVGIVCFRKIISQSGRQSSDRYARQSSILDQAALTPSADLPSPPPCYFNENDNIPPSIIRGTYFFGNEFSQSGIHSASLFGIPPPRYRSRESLHRLCPNTNFENSQRQEEMSNLASRQTSVCANEIQSQREQFVSGNISSEDNLNSTSTEDIPLVDHCCLADEDKDDEKLTDSETESQQVNQQTNENTQAAILGSDQTAAYLNISNPDTNIS